MIDRYGLDHVDMVGFTSMFSQNVATLAMARRIKERNPGVVIVMGGANCESPMGRELVELARAESTSSSPAPRCAAFPSWCAA